jgi:transcriptional regulator with XRE-family HTH domain
MAQSELKTRLKQALLLRNMKPIELSEKTGISKSAISQYMSGYAKPKQDRIYSICKILDVSEAWLMGFDVPMEGEQTKKIQPSILTYYNQLNSLGKQEADKRIEELTHFSKYTSRKYISS